MLGRCEAGGLAADTRTVRKINLKFDGGAMKIYISGPITGTEDYMERFQTAEEKLAAEGHMVYNPAALNDRMPEGTTYEEYMQTSFCLLDIAEAIYMMDGWEKSKGALREMHYACAKEKSVFFEREGGVK